MKGLKMIREFQGNLKNNLAMTKKEILCKRKILIKYQNMSQLIFRTVLFIFKNRMFKIEMENLIKKYNRIHTALRLM